MGEDFAMMIASRKLFDRRFESNEHVLGSSISMGILEEEPTIIVRSSSTWSRRGKESPCSAYIKKDVDLLREIGLMEAVV